MFPPSFNQLSPDAKTNFALNARTLATYVATCVSLAKAISGVWDARLYGPGAENALTDADLVSAGIKADDLYALIIFCSQFNAFVTNGTPVRADYEATLDKVRRDM